MTVLLTGANGFIGRNVHRLLLARGCDVVAVSRSMPSNGDGRWIEADLLQPGAADFLMDRVMPDRLIHLAWNATPGKFWRAEDNFDWVYASADLVRAFWRGGGGRAVVAGSCAEYDWTGSGCLAEQSLRSPATLYGASKDALNRLLSSLAAQNGHQLAWARVFWLYGPEDPPGRLVSDLAGGLAQGVAVACGDGSSQRDFLHVHDVARALVDLAWSDVSGDVNISSGHAVPVLDIIEKLAQISGRADLVQLGARATPQGEPPVLFGQNEILSNYLNFKPNYTLETGLRSTFDWWKNNYPSR